MINTISDMLLAFMEKEKAELADYELKHGPTIGNMYEGLSTKILEQAIPNNLDLRVVEGFIVDATGKLSGQMDCMLVTGEGEQIPHTNSYKWPIWDVLAVIEVKKNLYGQDLQDSFHHLRSVNHAFNDWLNSGARQGRKVSIETPLRTFSTITGIHAPEFADRETLSESLQLIYHTLVVEYLSPALIVFGYEGYKSEISLREGMFKFLESVGAGQGYGVPSFPHQITCNGHSLVKISGCPYMAPMEDDYWMFYTSSPSNPLWILIEIIWTKISHRFKLSMPWGEDLEDEVMHQFLGAKPQVENGQGGWYYQHFAMKDGGEETTYQEPWAPKVVTSAQFVVFNELCRKEKVDSTDPKLIAFVEKEGQTIDEFIADMQKTGYVSMDGKWLRLTTIHLECAILPRGGFVVAENNTGRLTRYIEKSMRDPISDE